MATSGRIETGRVSNHTLFYIQWQLAGQDIAGNYSTVHAQAGINIANNAWWGTNAVKITGGGVNGNPIHTGTWSNQRGNGDKQLVAHTFNVPHNGDGTKSFYYDVHGNLLGVGGSVGGWADLPTIPRQSNPSFSKTLYTLGERITLFMNRKAGFTHRGSIQVPDENKIYEFSNIADQVDWTPTAEQIEEIYRRMANTTRTSLGSDITTWNGGTQIGGVGWNNAEIQLPVEQIRPDFSDFDFADTNTRVTALTGDSRIFVQGASKLTATITPAQKMIAKKHATPVNYTLTFDGQTATANFSNTETVTLATQNITQSSGNLTVQISAKDSRGLTRSASKTVQIVPYSKPAFAITAKRQNNFDPITELKIGGNFAPITVANTDRNRIENLRFRYRETGETFNAWKNVTPSQSGGTFQAPTQFLDLNSSSSYEIEVETTDKLGNTSTATVVVDKGSPIVFFSSNYENVGVGKVPTTQGKGDLDVAGDIYARGKKINGGGGTHVGQVIISTTLKTPEAVSAEYGGTWALWGQGRTIIGVGSNGENNYPNAEMTGGWDRVTLTWGQMPVHDHGLNIRAFTSQVAGANTRRDGISTGSQHSNSEYRFNDPTNRAGNNEPHENRSKFITAYFWRKTAN